jgi:hypothetical protein
MYQEALKVRMSISLTVICTSCGYRLLIQELTEQPLPQCPTCAAKSWSSTNVEKPLPPYEVTHGDARFLKTLKIDPEVG